METTHGLLLALAVLMMTIRRCLSGRGVTVEYWLHAIAVFPARLKKFVLP